MIYIYNLTWQYTDKAADLAALDNETIVAFSDKFPPNGTENFTISYGKKLGAERVVYNTSWELSESEKTTLDAVVANHVPV